MAGIYFVRVAPYENLLSHSRFLLTLRSQEGKYHSLILFRLSTGHDDSLLSNVSQQSTLHSHHQLYAMESACPHLGADMSHADIEECEDSVVVVCPWHRYDFDLRTGESETGLRACTYAVKVEPHEPGGLHIVWVEAPDNSQWQLVELRPVSESFAELPSAVINSAPVDTSSVPSQLSKNVVPMNGPPSTLMEWAVLILNTSDPMLKVKRTKHAVHLFYTGQLTSVGHKSKRAPQPPAVPPRDDNYTRNIVEPRKLGKRKNAAVMLHALANIEQWAIDLAWDIMARFGPSYPEIPPAFFSDFSRMALDESKHFTLLVSRLSEISPSTPYGSLPVHAGLWESATTTANSLRARLAIIHLVHEARGLDVNPATIERFRRSGDPQSVKVLEVIHHDEVTHVTSGHRWFTWICQQQGVDPVKTFREEVRRGWRGEIKGPFNIEARETAGMTRDFYEDLRGEMDTVDRDASKTFKNVSLRAADCLSSAPSVQVDYEKGS
ncbi:hypothetical protein V8B97DRAFT_1874662 [Scleroderma yunnanense]